MTQSGQSKALAGKVAIVTGAARGIGKATAMAFAREGASVVVAARSVSEGEIPGTIQAAARDIQALGVKALAVKCDITIPDDVEKMAAVTMKEFGRIDILVNNAGIWFRGYEIKDMPIELWDQTFATNLRGAFLCCRAVLPQMVAQKRGSIINVSSISARRQRTGGKNIAYGVSKAALERFTVGLAQEVKQHNIAVNAMEPTMLLTERLIVRDPAARNSPNYSPPEKIGPAMVFLAQQDGAGFTGQCVARGEFGNSWP